MSAIELATSLHELELTIPAVAATKYLSAAGLMILLYDHLLLFGDETRLIWRTGYGWPKVLFLINRYTVPLCIAITAYQLSGLATAGLSTSFCQTWLSLATFLGISTLGIANVFVVKRVYALWGHSRRVLVLLCSSFVMVYFSTLLAAGAAIARLRPQIVYAPSVKTCIIKERPVLLIAAYSVPVFFDIFLFSLTCWNALDRPRHMQIPIVKQLYLDGVVYFIAVMSLRLINIILFAAAPIAWVQFAAYFIWSMITALINRMLITLSKSLERTRDGSGTATATGHEDEDEDEDGDGDGCEGEAHTLTEVSRMTYGYDPEGQLQYRGFVDVVGDSKG